MCFIGSVSFVKNHEKILSKLLVCPFQEHNLYKTGALKSPTEKFVSQKPKRVKMSKSKVNSKVICFIDIKVLAPLGHWLYYSMN
jgi:hypothetical protein